MSEGNYKTALRYLEGSKEYPERLGSGRPYDPDFRMQDFLEVLCYDQMNKGAQAEKKRKVRYCR